MSEERTGQAGRQAGRQRAHYGGGGRWFLSTVRIEPMKKVEEEACAIQRQKASSRPTEIVPSIGCPSVSASYTPGGQTAKHLIRPRRSDRMND